MANHICLKVAGFNAPIGGCFWAPNDTLLFVKLNKPQKSSHKKPPKSKLGPQTKAEIDRFITKYIDELDENVEPI